MLILAQWSHARCRSNYRKPQRVPERVSANHGSEFVMVHKEIVFTVHFPGRGARVVCETETRVSYNGWVFNKA